MDMIVWAMKCTVYCTAEYYRLKDIVKIFSHSKVTLHENDVLSVQYEEGDIFCLFFGCIVFWDVPTQAQARIIEQMRPCSKGVLNTVEMEVLSLEVAPNVTAASIDGDVITIPHKNYATLLVLSYALAQAARLNSFERTLDALTIATRQLPGDLASKGKSNITQRALTKIIGRTFLLSNSINIQSDIWDTPELLWLGDSTQMQTYQVIREKTEIEKRAHLIDKRLVIIQQLCTMLHENRCTQRSLRLEIAIVALIALETVGFFAQHIF